MIRALFLLAFLCANQASWSQQYVISTLAGGIPPATPAAADGASIGDPPRVAVDASGNVYFASVHSVFKVDRTGTLTRLAGTGRYGSSGDGGPALNAQLAYPDGLAVDGAGNVYVTDRDANVIRRISAAGVISTFAGTGTRGFSGDAGPALNAQLNGPTGLTLDSTGALYVADTGNSSIRRIATDGSIVTVAGTGGRDFDGDGGPATKAVLNGPEGIAVDLAGNFYIADTFNNRIRKVSTDGIITTFAGDGFPGGSGDDGPAEKATLFLPTDVAVDRAGTLYIADLGASRIRIVAKGIISSVAGKAVEQLATDGLPALSVRLSGPTGVAVDSSGTFYFAEGSIGSGSGLTSGDFKIWKVGPNGILITVAGTGHNSLAGDGGLAVKAQINTPSGIAFDSAGNLYFADTGNQRIRKISTNGTISTVAGNGIMGFAGDGGPATQAVLNQPVGVAVDSEGHIFIADSANNRIREVLSDGTIGTFAGNGNAAFFGDGTAPIFAAIHAPRGLAFDPAGNLYIADTQDHRVRKINPDNTIVTVAGNGQPGFSGDGGPAINAALNLPSSIAFDSAGNLYIADQANNRIRKVSTNGTISTVAGTDTVFTGDGGPAAIALISHPQGVAVDRAGNLYISETGENRIRKVTTDGIISTLAGTGNCCYSNDGGPANQASLNQPWGVAVDPAGNVYIGDSGNNAIRLVQPVPTGAKQGAILSGASFLPGAIAPGQVVAITGTGLGPNPPVQFQTSSTGVVGTQLGGVSVLFNGIFAPILYASPGQVSAVVPYGVSGENVQVVGQYQSLITLTTSVPLTATAPAFFTADSSGKGQAAAVNQDNLSNSPSHPAPIGSVITLYATGEGQTSPSGIDGKLGSVPLPRPVLPLTVTIGGQLATVQSASGGTGLVAGIMQLSVQIPSGIQAGTAVPVVLRVGDVPSPAGVTIAVQ